MRVLHSKPSPTNLHTTYIPNLYTNLTNAPTPYIPTLPLHDYPTPLQNLQPVYMPVMSCLWQPTPLPTVNAKPAIWACYCVERLRFASDIILCAANVISKMIASEFEFDWCCWEPIKGRGECWVPPKTCNSGRLHNLSSTWKYPQATKKMMVFMKIHNLSDTYLSKTSYPWDEWVLGIW